MDYGEHGVIMVNVQWAVDGELTPDPEVATIQKLNMEAIPVQVQTQTHKLKLKVVPLEKHVQVQWYI